jgi:methionine-rich copper-binding protein CopC
MSTRYATPSAAGAAQGAARRVVARAMAGALLVLAATATTVAAVAVPATPAWAHARLARASPADGATVTGTPRQVQLVFDAPVQPGFATVAVTAPGGAQVQRGDPQIRGAAVVQPLRPAPMAGRYTVAYRVVSADGHPVTRELTFVYAPPGGAAAASTPAEGSPPPMAAATRPEQGGAGDWVSDHAGHVAAGLIVVLGGVFVVWRERRRGDDR